MVSVHTFAANTQIFSIFAIYVVALSIYSVFQYGYISKESTSVSWVMRFQYFTTLFFIGFFLLTIVLPMLYELLYHTPLILQPVFFKKLTIPFLLIIFYGMSVYLRPTIIAYAAIIITAGMYYFYTNDWQSAVAIGSGIGILTTYLYWKAWNIPHAAFITMVILMLLNAQQSFSEDIILSIGDSSVINGVEVMLDTVSDARGSNYIEKQATITLNGEKLYPSIRYFPVNDTAIAHTDTKLFSYYEWHVIMGAQLEDGAWSIQVHCQYWLRWIWGVALITALAFFARSRK
jgi:cytochrome c biogenesis factor